MALLLSAFVHGGCQTKRRLLVPYEAQQKAADEIELYRTWSLLPARVPPPQVDPGPHVVQREEITAQLTLVRPEDAEWNQWTDGQPRLFNNRVAHVFEVSIAAPGDLLWRPSDSTLELNSPEVSIQASGSAEGILSDLAWFALQEERWVLDGDLVARTRGAGPFREGYLPVSAADRLEGLVAFPLLQADPSQADLGSMQVVAMRVRLVVEHDGRLRTLEWVLQ